MSALDDLIAQVGDPALRSRLEEEARQVQEGRKFGLVFEEHLPDDTLLPGVPVRRGGLAARRGDAGGGLLRVLRVAGGKVLCADASAAATAEGCAAVEIPLGELVAAARPGEPVYPFLAEMDRIDRGGPDAPWHALIEADNAHALQFLQYVCGGKVDCIYVDPPYNTGARDWKYNNDYVDQNDAWRHSKWLSMMKRRLRLAKKLLNPKDSVLIVTIDEKEYLHLGCLLEEMFPEARIQMVSSVINPKGVSSTIGFKRADEYLFFVMFGTSAPCPLPLGSEWSPSFAKVIAGTDIPAREEELGWTSMMRRGTSAHRADRPGLFYAIFVNPTTKMIQHVGNSIPAGLHCDKEIPGLRQVLPIRTNGEEGRWQIGPEELRQRIAQGRIRVGQETSYGFVINYLPDGEYQKIQNGEYEVYGRAADGSLLTQKTSANAGRLWIAPTQWKISSHDASAYGSAFLQDFDTWFIFISKVALCRSRHHSLFRGEQARRADRGFLRGERHDVARREPAERRGRRASALHHGDEQRGIGCGGDGAVGTRTASGG